MIIKRDRAERGKATTDWLDSRHSFSFGHYYDPKHMGFGALRVINEDKVIPSSGFDRHPHRNMEIISYVLEGELAHKDSMGNGSRIKQGEVQLMSAGSGVTHSEYNASDEKAVHFLQIWIMPFVSGTAPDYQQKTFIFNKVDNFFKVVVSQDGEDGSLTIKQDARLLIGKFSQGNIATVKAKKGYGYWVQIARGNVTVNGEMAVAGDGLALHGEDKISVKATMDSEVLLFELAGE